MDHKSTDSPQPGMTSAPADKTKHEAHETADRFRAAGEEVKEQASRKGADVMQDAKDELHDVTQEARSYGSQLIRSQQKAIASRIHEYGEAARAASEKLKEEGHESTGRHVSAAAERIEKTARYLGDSEPNALLEDAQDFAEERPELVYGGMFIAGLAVARLLKASRRRSRSGNGARAHASDSQDSFESVERFPNQPETRV